MSATRALPPSEATSIGPVPKISGRGASVGMLPTCGGAFRFGVSVFPSLYADALYALDELDRIFETDGASSSRQSVRIRRLRTGRGHALSGSAHRQVGGVREL